MCHSTCLSHPPQAPKDSGGISSLKATGQVIHSTNIYCGSKMFQELLGAGDACGEQSCKVPPLMELTFQWGKTGNAQINKEST